VDELTWDELLSGGADEHLPYDPGDVAPTGPGRDRHARRSRVRPPSVLDLRAQTPVGGVTPEITAERVLDLASPPAPQPGTFAPPPETFAAPPAALPPEIVEPVEPAEPAEPAPPVDPDAADEQRALEERVAQVLRSPETLRGVHQPIVDLHTGDCVGYEAFVRIADWPARSPRPWFDAAARVGLAAQLEAAALATSLRARLTMPGDRLLAVNLSTASLTDDHVLRVLDDEDDLTRLLLTPSPARDALAPATAADALAALRGRGLLLGMKLREAGRTDLHVLDGLRPDVVVLTREFAADIHAAASRQRLLLTLVGIAAETGAAVLATGIESVADARCLQQSGVHLGQGWLFGRPRPGFLPPPAGTEEWVREIASAGPDDGEADGEADGEDGPVEGRTATAESLESLDALEDAVARRVAEANAMTTPPGIPVGPPSPAPVPRPRARSAEGGAGRHTAEHPAIP
jgi:EAL domain-containing protein (putative c-di-GMP-specific phosphodiesterase class I)